MPIHPKTSGAAVGGALGVLIVAILGSIHGVHLTAEANAAIPSFLSIVLAWLTPAPAEQTVPVVVQVAPTAPVRPTSAPIGVADTPVTVAQTPPA